MLVHLTLSQCSLRLSFLFSLFYLFLFLISDFHLNYSFVACILFFVASNEVFVSVIVFCISACLILKSSLSLLSVSYNLSIFSSNLFLRSWIIFIKVMFCLEGHLSTDLKGLRKWVVWLATEEGAGAKDFEASTYIDYSRNNKSPVWWEKFFVNEVTNKGLFSKI